MIILIPVQKRERVGWGGVEGEAQACVHAKLFKLLVSVTINQLRDAHLLQLVGSAKLGRNQVPQGQVRQECLLRERWLSS